jgi:hypothetical protein
MDKAFIEKNQIVERYLAGKLPFKGRQDFERFCRENPDALEDMKFSDAVHAGVRLLEQAGKPKEWHEAKPEWWRQPAIFFAPIAVAALLVIWAWYLLDEMADLKQQVATLEKRLDQGPLRPPGVTRTVRIVPERSGPTSRAALTVQLGERPELIELRVDVSFARQNAFRLTSDKRDRARAGTIHNLVRDSNGILRLTLNTSGLHPGDYQVAIEGVTMRGALVPVAWFTVRVTR